MNNIMNNIMGSFLTVNNMAFINRVYEKIDELKKCVNRIFLYAYETAAGNIDKWIYVKDHSYLIPKFKFGNNSNVSKEWEYDLYNNSITWVGNDCDKNKNVKFKMLSIEIIINNKKYNDNNSYETFLENTKIYCPNYSHINNKIVFLCWAVSANAIFNTSDNINFKYMNLLGEWVEEEITF